MKKNSQKATTKTIEEILTELDFRYILDIDYSTSRYCDDSDSCCDEWACRCGVIEDACIEGIIDLHKVTNHIMEATLRFFTNGNSTITQYCIDRILHITKMYENDSWEIGIREGYYGQEIDSVTIENSKCIEYISMLSQLLSDEQRIEYVLALEYSFVADHVMGLDWKVGGIAMKDVVFPSHSQKLAVKNVDSHFYSNWQLPLGIVIEKNGKYELVDGYHRTMEAKEREFGLFVIGRTHGEAKAF